MEITIEQIKERLGIKKGSTDKNYPYIGLEMGATSEEEMKKCREENYNTLISCFYGYFGDLNIKDFNLWSWKGSIWIGDKKGLSPDNVTFNGWESEDIIYWLIKNKHYFDNKKIERELKEKSEEEEEEDLQRYKKIEREIYRYISKENRYLVLKRQKWRCNSCGCKLKYSQESDWKGEIAHIDHIYPFSKKESYINEKENINELSNLQALCPKCNRNKKDRIIH